MQHNASKHNKYALDLPYPKPMIDIPNIEYDNLLLKDYAGTVSEFTAISLYVYQQFASEEKYTDYINLVSGISIIEMKHLKLLGETIKLEGIEPMYIDNASPHGKLWSPMYVNYTTHLISMLKEDIKSEQKAMENYKYHIKLIQDKHIVRLLERIILDEELHLKLFIQEYEKYAK